MKFNKIIDSFFVCGLDPRTGLELNSIIDDTDDSNVIGLIPLNRSFKASLLQKFIYRGPMFDFPEDLSVISLCMPDGLRLYTESTVTHEPINHTFTIVREDASKIYGTALIFVEEVRDDGIKKKLIDLQTGYRMEHSESTRSQLFGINGSATEENSLTNGRGLNMAATEFWMEGEKLYTSKAIGILSKQPYMNCFQSWLYDIWLLATGVNRLQLPTDINHECEDQSRDSDSTVNVEKCIYNMLFEVNSPDRGKCQAIDGPFFRHFCRCPDDNDLPIFEMPIRSLLEVLGLENFIRVYSCVMLEYRVVILSKDYRLLMLVSECITTLLFPFVWPHVYAPILPLATRHFLNAPVPFIMGIKLGFNESAETIQLASDASVCYVNIDQQTVTTADDIPIFPYHLDLRSEITEILVHLIESKTDDVFVSPKLQQSHKINIGEVNSINNFFDSRTTDNSLQAVNSNIDDDCSVVWNNSSNVSSPNGRLSTRKLSQYSNNQSVSSPLSKESGICVHEFMQSMLKCDDRFNKAEKMARNYCDLLKINKVFRELFLNHFLHIFRDYEQFLILPPGTMSGSNYLNELVSTQTTFDKAGFLSEQPETHLPFLSAFLETQMFASFIDMKILSTYAPAHPNLSLFERNLNMMKDTVLKQLTLSPQGYISFKPYFHIKRLIKDTEIEFNRYLSVMSDTLPQRLYLLSNLNQDYIFSHRSDFPWLNAEYFTMDPSHVDLKNNLNGDLQMVSQDLEFNNMDPTIDGELRLKNILIQTRTLDYGLSKKAQERFDRRSYLAGFLSGEILKNDETFVKILLQESQAKTKRMVLEKMGGQQAVELVHGDNRFVCGIEENTLVACLCDLLERMWCHGLIGSHGKSALWTHLNKYADREQNQSTLTQIKNGSSDDTVIKEKSKSKKELVKDALVNLGVNSYCLYRYFNVEFNNNDTVDNLRCVKEEAQLPGRSRISTPEFIYSAFAIYNNESNSILNWDSQIPGTIPVLNPFSVVIKKAPIPVNLTSIFGALSGSLVDDIKAIKTLTDIKTEVGFARAFVRLALERKTLSGYLRTLLSDSRLLSDLYGRCAFLRCKKECEKFLSNLLALQAVDYYSFTNLYVNSELIYRVYIHCGQRYTTGKSTSASAWFFINGHHCNTGVIAIPRDVYQFDFKNQNLGILTTMKIGHDNSGLSPKWYIEFILVQNKITGQIYKFPCNHWLSKGDDDGSIERLLIGEEIRIDEDEKVNENGNEPDESQMFSRSQSQCESRHQNDKLIIDLSMIQEQLGNSVNNLVKYFCRQQDREKLTVNRISGSCNVTVLLCGQGGLVPSIERVFRYGFINARFMRKNRFPWDYLEKVAKECQHDFECRGRCLTDKGKKSKCSASLSDLVSDARITRIQQFYELIKKISTVNRSIGKDGKFQRFVCISVRDHMFPWLIDLFSLVDCTESFYDKSGFFRNRGLYEVLIEVLSSLDGFAIPLEAALTDNM